VNFPSFDLSVSLARWWRQAFSLRGSVVPDTLPRSLVCGLFGVVVTVFYEQGYTQLHLPFLGSIIPNLVLGLLLVFRTNTAYDRYWEGRKAWGSIINAVRNLARHIWVAVYEREEGDRPKKKQALRWLVVFARATKQYLRQEPLDEDLVGLTTAAQHQQLQRVNHPALEVAFWLGDYLQHQYERECLNIYQLNTAQTLLNQLVDSLGICERIKRTPIPLAYAIHLKQLLVMYCFSLPFQTVEALHWATGPVTALVGFTLLGVEEIALQIEDPFGRDPNDLPLDAICQVMLRNIEDLMALPPPKN